MRDLSPFEQHRDEYEAWFVRNDAIYRSELAAIRKLMPGRGRGLEIGVGSGLFAGPLGIREGIDPSPGMLALARQRGILAVRGVAESLPFPDRSFDFALMVTTVCFLDDIDLAFSEAFRVLKAQGVFLIGFVDKESPIGRSYREKKDKSLFYRDAVFYSVPDLLSRLRPAGFGNFRFVQTLFHPLSESTTEEPVREGCGEGSFVVIGTEKTGEE